MIIMNTYQFTLVLNGVNETTPLLEESLYEAGCNDALINFRNGTVYLDFDRQALSFEKAVLSAIKDIESSSTGATVVTIAPESWVSEADIAKRLHMKRQAVSLWVRGERRASDPFPRAVMKLAEKSPLWRWSEVVQWLYRNHLITDKAMVVEALFIENMNVALEERDKHIRDQRQKLLKKLAA